MEAAQTAMTPDTLSNSLSSALFTELAELAAVGRATAEQQGFGAPFWAPAPGPLTFHAGAR